MSLSALQQINPVSTLEIKSIQEAVDHFARAGIEARGAIFTRREVVEFILDLAGYTHDKSLHTMRLLEPSFGQGDFLLIVIERLLKAWRREGMASGSLDILLSALTAVELHEHSFHETRRKVLCLLEKQGFSSKQALSVADAWLVRGDYLLINFDPEFDFVVGNPPYVRQELIPNALMAEYRSRYPTVYDRADLYIPFLEHSLRLLAKGGTLGFICADRWMKNRYGGPLRKFVAESFHLKIYVDMVDTPAFHSDVVAYPAITIVVNEKPGKTRVAHRPDISSSHLIGLSRALRSKGTIDPTEEIREFDNVASGVEPWILESADQLGLVRRLERDFPLIEEAGCKIGIGVATGADNAFIAPYDKLDVEEDRKLPLVTTRDIVRGTVHWKGLGIVNPFADEGCLVDLDTFPKLKVYFEDRKELIIKRHVAKKTPSHWYRTIDRIYPHLATTPKLLIPDIKGDANIVYEAGHLYPHHNLYYITSVGWDLFALQAILKSGIAKLFVSIYSTKMRGGFLRYQAQYLRRIRLPRWEDVEPDARRILGEAGKSGDIASCNAAVIMLYGLSRLERRAFGGNGE